MNVLHVLDERWDSGLTAYGLSVAGALRERGHHVSIAAQKDSPAYRSGVKEKFPVFTLSSFCSLGQTLRREKIDIVNAHTGASHTRSFLASRWTSAALVRTRAEASQKNPVPQGAPLRRPRPGQSFLLRRTDGIIAASQSLGDAYGDCFPFLRERLAVIPPGVVLPPVSPEPDGPLRVGLLARLDPVKGHRYFLEAVAQLKDRTAGDVFLVAGEDKNVTRAALEELSNRLGVADRVQFLGRVPDAAAFIRSCHVGVVSSTGSEAVSRVALEWLAQGRPLVATAVGALPELVLSGDNGYLVPPRSASGLARVLRLLLEDGASRRRMGERARRTVETRFSLTRLGEETEKLYHAALLRRRGGTT